MLKLRYYTDKISSLIMKISFITLMSVIPLLMLIETRVYGKCTELFEVTFNTTLWTFGISFAVCYVTDKLTQAQLDRILSTGKYSVIYRDIEETYCEMYDNETKYIYHWRPSKEQWLEPMLDKHGKPFKCTKKYLKKWGYK